MSEPAKVAEAAVPQTPVLDGAVSEKIKQYNKAVRTAKLSSILLEKIDFQISPDALRAERSDLKRDLNVQTKILSYDPSAGDCVASIVWTIEVKYKRKKVVKCTAHYIIVYEIKECPEDAIRMFIDHVGKTATYAYFRALYAHIDWSANLRSAPLPVVHFQPSVSGMKSPQESKS